MHKRMLYGLLAAVLCFSLTAQAGSINSDVGTTAFPFLKIGVGARAVSMGGAFTGLADDASAIYYNPAGLAAFEHPQYIAGYHNYFMDIQSGFAGYIFKLNEEQSLAASVNYLNYGEFIEADTSGTETGNTFGGGDMMFAVSYARKLGYSYQAGITAKVIYEKVDEFSATGLALDLGAAYTTERKRFGAGVAVQNLGTQLSSLGEEEYDLPLTLRGGVFVKPRGLPLTLTSDLILPSDNDMIIAVGAEYYELDPFYVRVGWNSFGSNYRTADSDDSWAGVALGFGFNYRQLHIAYAFTPGAELGDNHRITITGGVL